MKNIFEKFAEQDRKENKEFNMEFVLVTLMALAIVISLITINAKVV